MADGPDHILVEHDGPLTIVTINRPEARNAPNAAASRELAEA
nr:hypothetical protein [Sphingomonas sp. Y57]